MSIRIKGATKKVFLKDIGIGNYYPDSDDIIPNIVKDLSGKYKKEVNL